MKDALDRFAHDAGLLSGQTTLAAFLAELFPPGAPVEVDRHRRRLAGGDGNPPPRTGRPFGVPSTTRTHDQTGAARRLAWLAAGALVAALLVLLGAATYGRLGGPRGLGAHKPPELQIQAPPGAVARLNDRALPGASPWNIPLTARTEYVVRVEMAGYYPVETAIQLDEDDIRILAFQLEELTAEKRE